MPPGRRRPAAIRLRRMAVLQNGIQFIGSGVVSEETTEEQTCPTCGATTTATGHLCRPFKPVKPHRCEYCGAETDDPRHMCYPQVEHLKYQCIHCGRLAAKAEALCHPKRIAGA